MVSNDFTRLKANYCCYFKWFKNSYIILLLYIDDMPIHRTSIKEITNLKARLVEKFSMKDLGLTKNVFGMKISREKRDC